MTIPRPVAYALYCVPWLACMFGIGALVLARFPLDGRFRTQTSLEGRNPWIQTFLPSQRASAPGIQPDGWVGQRLTADPVYLNARAPGPYQQVKVEIEFRSLRQPLVEWGMVRDAAGTELEMQPLYSSELENQNWHEAKGGGYVLGNTPSARLMDPRPDGLATWLATTTAFARMDQGAMWQEKTVSLRGTHDIYAVPIDGHLRFHLALQAANRSQGGDIAAIRVFFGEDEIDRKAVSVSGSRDIRLGAKAEQDIDIKQAQPGIYRIQVTASDDVFIRTIGTDSKHWVLGPRFVIGDQVGYATTTASLQAWTNSRHLIAETFHREGLQPIEFGSVKRELKETHEQIRLDRSQEPEAIAKLVAPQGDIRFIGDGFFAYTPEAFFEPRPRRMTDGSSLVLDGVVAVRTPYMRPQDLGDGWKKATLDFALKPNQRDLRFVLSAPGMAARVSAVDIRRVDMVFERPVSSWQAWWDILKQELVVAWQRL